MASCCKSSAHPTVGHGVPDDLQQDAVLLFSFSRSPPGAVLGGASSILLAVTRCTASTSAAAWERSVVDRRDLEQYWMGQGVGRDVRLRTRASY